MRQKQKAPVETVFHLDASGRDTLKYLSYTAKMPPGKAAAHALALCALSLRKGQENKNTCISEGMGGSSLHKISHTRGAEAKGETSPVNLAVTAEMQDDIHLIRKLPDIAGDNAAFAYGLKFAAGCIHIMRGAYYGRIVFANTLLRQKDKYPTVFDDSLSNAFRSGAKITVFTASFPLTAEAEKNLGYLSETAALTPAEAAGEALALCSESLRHKYMHVATRGEHVKIRENEIAPLAPAIAEAPAQMDIPLTQALDEHLAGIRSVTRGNDAQTILFALDYAAACVRELRARNGSGFVLSNGFPKEKPQKIRTAFDDNLSNSLRHLLKPGKTAP